MAAILLVNGAKVNARSTNGRTPLHLACSFGHYSLAQLLVDAGGDVNAREDALETPLHQACRRDDTELLDLLSSKGADIEAEAIEHKTALQIAACCGSEASAKWLRERGAKARVAIALAKHKGHDGIVHILEGSARS